MKIKISDGLDNVIDVIHSLQPSDRKSARFHCGRQTLRMLRRLSGHEGYISTNMDEFGFTLFGFPLEVYGEGGLELVA